MGFCLFSLSFATVLFTLAIFKLLSFFIMPSLFFDLLFIGFPIGAFLGAVWFTVDLRSFQRSLWLLQGVTLGSVVAVLFAKNFKYFDYLRAHLFEVEVPKLLYQMGTFTGLFLPFFAAYGLSEYIGYQLGRRLLAGRMRVVYALYLFGAAAAYFAFKLCLPQLGISRILAIALLCIALSMIALSKGLHRAVAAVEILLIGGLLAVPGIEAEFLRLYKGEGYQSTRQYERDYRCEIVFQKWGQYSLCEIMRDPEGEYHGFYNDFFQWRYAPSAGFSVRSLGMVPLLETRPDSRVAIIGSGGGRQVRFAERSGIREIVAIEIEPAVFEAVRDPRHLLDEFGRVYEARGVRPVRSEARSFMENSEDRFDLIYLPSVGGYPQMMMEPGNLIRTHEAYQTLMRRLTDDGMLAIWYPRGLDEKDILTTQYVRTLRALGLKTVAYQNALDTLILACRDPGRRFPSQSDMIRLFFAAEGPRQPLPPLDQQFADQFLPRVLRVEDDAPGFTPITDDKPFLAGNVRHILSERQVYELFGIGGGLLLSAGLIVLVALRRRGDPGIPERSYWNVAALTLLIGANFLVMEHYLVLALFRKTFVYYDSLMLGAISFLVLSGIGSMLATRRFRMVSSCVAVGAAMALLLSAEALPASAVVALVAPIALATGTYFPQIFELAARNPLAVFALDAIGAGLGTLLSTFVPIAFGFGVFFVIAAGLFVATAAANGLFHHKRPRVVS